jgi:hypothetical protein
MTKQQAQANWWDDDDDDVAAPVKATPSGKSPVKATGNWWDDDDDDAPSPPAPAGGRPPPVGAAAMAGAGLTNPQRAAGATDPLYERSGAKAKGWRPEQFAAVQRAKGGSTDPADRMALISWNNGDSFADMSGAGNSDPAMMGATNPETGQVAPKGMRWAKGVAQSGTDPLAPTSEVKTSAPQWQLIPDASQKGPSEIDRTLFDMGRTLTAPLQANENARTVVGAPIQFGQGLAEGGANMLNNFSGVGTDALNAGMTLANPGHEAIQAPRIDVPRNVLLEAGGVLNSDAGIAPRIAGQFMAARVPLGRAMPKGGVGNMAAKDAAAFALTTDAEAPRLSDWVPENTPLGDALSPLRSREGDPTIVGMMKNLGEDLMLSGVAEAAIAGGKRVMQAGRQAPAVPTNAGGANLGSVRPSTGLTPEQVATWRGLWDEVRAAEASADPTRLAAARQAVQASWNELPAGASDEAFSLRTEPTPQQPAPASVQTAQQPSPQPQAAAAPPVPPTPPAAPVATAASPPGPAAQGAPPAGQLTPVPTNEAVAAFNALPPKTREAMLRALQSSGMDKSNSFGSMLKRIITGEFRASPQAMDAIRAIQNAPEDKQIMFALELMKNNGGDLETILPAMGRKWATEGAQKDQIIGGTDRGREIMDQNVRSQINAQGDYVTRIAEDKFGPGMVPAGEALDQELSVLAKQYDGILNPQRKRYGRLRNPEKLAAIDSAHVDLQKYLKRPDVIDEMPDWVKTKVMLQASKDMRNLGFTPDEMSLILAGDGKVLAPLFDAAGPLKWTPAIWKHLVDQYPTQAAHILQSSYRTAADEILGGINPSQADRADAAYLMRLRGESGQGGLIDMLERAIPGKGGKVGGEGGYQWTRKSFGDNRSAERAFSILERFKTAANSEGDVASIIKELKDLPVRHREAAENQITSLIRQELGRKIDSAKLSELGDPNRPTTPNLTALSNQNFLNALEDVFGPRGKELADGIRLARASTDTLTSLHPKYNSRTQVNAEDVKNAGSRYEHPGGLDGGLVDNSVKALASGAGAAAIFQPQLVAPIAGLAGTKALYNAWKKGKRLSNSERNQLIDYLFRTRKAGEGGQPPRARPTEPGGVAARALANAAVGATAGGLASNGDPTAIAAGAAGGAVVGAARKVARGRSTIIPPQGGRRPPNAPRNALNPAGPQVTPPPQTRTLPGQQSNSPAAVGGAFAGAGISGGATYAATGDEDLALKAGLVGAVGGGFLGNRLSKAMGPKTAPRGKPNGPPDGGVKPPAAKPAVDPNDPFGDKAWASQKKMSAGKAPAVEQVDTSTWTPQDFQAARNQLNTLMKERKTAPAEQWLDYDTEIAQLKQALDLDDTPKPPAQSGIGGNKATLASAGTGIAYGELGPLQDMDGDGDKDAEDRQAMRVSYGMGGIVTPMLVRGAAAMARGRGGKGPPNVRGPAQAGVGGKRLDDSAGVGQSGGMGDDLYHGSPDVRGIKSAGGFEQRRRTASYYGDIDKLEEYRATLARLGDMPVNERPKEYWDALDGVSSLRREEEVPKAIYFATDNGTAKTYADDQRAWDFQNSKPGVLKAASQLDNPLTFNARGRKFSALPLDVVRSGMSAEQRVAFDNIVRAYADPTLTAKGIIRTDDLELVAHKAGYDGFKITNVIDDYHGIGKPTTVVGVLDASKVKLADAAAPALKSGGGSIQGPTTSVPQISRPKPPPAQGGFGGTPPPKGPSLKVSGPPKTGAPKRKAEEIQLRAELRRAKYAYTAGRRRHVLKENREELWAPLEAAELRAEENLAAYLERQANQQANAARWKDRGSAAVNVGKKVAVKTGNAIKTTMMKNDAEILKTYALGAGLITATALGARALAGPESGGDKKKKDVLAPTDKRYFTEKLKNDPAKLGPIQKALVEMGYLDVGDDDTKWGTRTQDAIEAYLAQKPNRNADFPLQDYDVPEMLADAYGGSQDEKGRWFYDTGEPIVFPPKKDQTYLPARPLRPDEARRMAHQKRTEAERKNQLRP